MKVVSMIRTGISVFAVAIAPAVYAQDTNEAPSGERADRGNAGDNAIVVTARKREETLNDVPLSITALDTQELASTGANGLDDIAELTPGLTFQTFNGGGLGSPVIRGLAQTDIASFDNNVGIFLDGVFVNAKANLNLALFGLERVEVVKGPQSALYGSNTFSGAINYVTIKPGFSTEGRVLATVGTDDRYDGSVRLSGPVSDTIAIGFGAAYSKFGGTIKNQLEPDENLGGWDDRITLYGQVHAETPTGIEANLFGYYGEDNLDASAGYILTNNCGGTLPPRVAAIRGGNQRTYYCGEVPARDSVAVDPAAFGVKSKTRLGYLDLSLPTGIGTIQSLSSISKFSVDALSDQELNATTPTSARRFLVPFVGDSEEGSQQLRLDGYDIVDGFNYSVGAYYYNIDQRQNFRTGTSPNFVPQVLNRVIDQNTESVAGFGLLEYLPTPEFTLHGEARYTSEKREFDFSNTSFATTTKQSLEKRFNYWTWRLSASYEPQPDLLMYASAARGVKSGGFNAATLAAEQAYDPESNITYEIGAKGTFANGLINATLALYYVDWSDVQLPVPSAVDAANVTANIGSATSKGLELGLVIQPTRFVSFDLGYAYADPTWNEGTIDFSVGRQCPSAADCGLQPGPNGGVDVSGLLLPRAVQHQFNGGVRLTQDVGAFEMFFRADVSYQSERYSRNINLQDDGARTLVNASIGGNINGMNVTLWARNLFDRKTVNSTVNEPEFTFFPVRAQSTFTTVFPANTRTAGITIGYDF